MSEMNLRKENFNEKSERHFRKVKEERDFKTKRVGWWSFFLQRERKSSSKKWTWKMKNFSFSHPLSVLHFIFPFYARTSKSSSRPYQIFHPPSRMPFFPLHVHIQTTMMMLEKDAHLQIALHIAFFHPPSILSPAQ